MALKSATISFERAIKMWACEHMAQCTTKDRIFRYDGVNFHYIFFCFVLVERRAFFPKNAWVLPLKKRSCNYTLTRSILIKNSSHSLKTGIRTISNLYLLAVDV